MNKKIWIIFGILAIVIGIGLYLYFSNNNNNNAQYEESKTATNSNNNNDSSTQNEWAENNSNTESSQNQTNAETSLENTTTSDSNSENTDITNKTTETPAITYREEELATYSTKIYSHDSARQNNISITCQTLNGTIVKNGATFSFCNTVGKASTAKGYQEADIYDRNGNKKKGLGGGNCQISSTLYNAVLATPNLVVTERHAHSNSVPYVQKGKDAAVAYGSYDFKFRNDTGNDIKIVAEATSSNVTTKLISLVAN